MFTCSFIHQPDNQTVKHPVCDVRVCGWDSKLLGVRADDDDEQSDDDEEVVDEFFVWLVGDLSILYV